MSLVLCTTTTANGPTGNDNNNNTDNISDDSNPVTICRCRAPIASLDCMEEFSGAGGHLDFGRSISLGSNPAIPVRHGSTPTPGLRYKNLGKSGLRISNVGLGTWPVFSPGVPEDQSEAILKLAVESGINIFDISEAHSETELGKIIQRSGWKRSSYVITTKIYWSTKSKERGLSRKHIFESVKASLQRLQFSYIDIVIIYKADSMCPMEEIVRAMTYVISQGWAMYWGTSRWSQVEIMEAYTNCRQFNCITPIVEQAEYHMFCREKCELYLPEMYNKIGVGLMAWGPLSMALADTQNGERLIFPKGSFKTKSHSYSWTEDELNKNEFCWTKEKATEIKKQNDRIRDLSSLAEKLGCSPAQLSIAWSLKHEPVQCLLLGATSAEQLHQSLQALQNHSKTIFDQIDRDELRRARTRCNPFETIRGSIFLNRAAVKMANMDAILDFMFTEPKDENGVPLVKDLLYFADVCAGPGGFSEYVLWRKKWQAKGFGFTLRNENDFKLDEFLAGNAETFDAYYGVKEDGNIFDPENIESLQRYVLSQTHDTGVHFMMADGGFQVDEKNIQEIKSKQLYLCQCLTALRENGSFVVKLFDIFTRFSVGLVYLMYKCFKQICIIKPNTSRPANSERYLVCKYKLSNTDTIRRHLFDINQEMWNVPNSDADTLELVPLEILTEDTSFFKYIVDSNNRNGSNQIASLLKIAAFSKDSKMIETRQSDIRRECLKAWHLPMTQRKSKVKMDVHSIFKQLMDSWFDEKEFMLAKEQTLTTKPNMMSNKLLSSLFRDRTDWSFVPIDTVEDSGKNIRTFFMSRGGRDVFYYVNGSYKPLQNVVLEISADTLIYGEIAKESIGEWKSQTIVYALHIIDGMILGGINIRHMPLVERMKMCEKFANSLNKPSKVINDGAQQICTSPISCKKLYKLNEFRPFFDRLNHYTLKDGRRRLGLKIRSPIGPDLYYIPRGLLFFNEMKPHIVKAFSKTRQKIYFMDNRTGNTFFQDQMKDPNAVYSSFKTTFICRRLWEWQIEHQVYEHLDDVTEKNEELWSTIM